MTKVTALDSATLPLAGNVVVEVTQGGTSKQTPMSTLGVPRGTALPGSPSDGDFFYHLTRNILYRYDGTNTRWVSVQLHKIDSWVFNVSSTLSFSATGSAYAANPHYNVYDILVEDFYCSASLSTTTAANYFTLPLYSEHGAFTSTLLGTISLQNDTQNQINHHRLAINTVVSKTETQFEWQRQRVGTGTISSIGVGFTYRTIG